MSPVCGIFLILFWKGLDVSEINLCRFSTSMITNIFEMCIVIYLESSVQLYIDLGPQQSAVCTSAVESQRELENNYLIIDRAELHCTLLYCTVIGAVIYLNKAEPLEKANIQV